MNIFEYLHDDQSSDFDDRIDDLMPPEVDDNSDKFLGESEDLFYRHLDEY
ncbi:hypothetical protein SAMN05421640_3448 [Ekhidna lutea]|uniref:Uncharacterized protein n=1 Tax=Ekhidna lutea TaxID=447679 RepID=A0A239LW24_EKHLU|nr:hypothetical protein [Ekhidna lutea]SNT34857.1 hypothetical protein SAMN05421640_3448 [Ekhidna lutea]